MCKNLEAEIQELISIVEDANAQTRALLNEVIEDTKRSSNSLVGDDDKIEVKHKKGTSDEKPDGKDSWKEYWEDAMGLCFSTDVNICDCCNKETVDFVGAHVVSIKDSKTYIFPLCRTCNSTYGEGKEGNKTFFARKYLLLELIND